MHRSEESGQPLERQQRLMRAIGALNPYGEADPAEVEQRIRNIKHGAGRANPA